MRKLFLIMLIMAWLAVPAMAETEDEAVEDNSVQYMIDLGDGQGAILVFGDNNTIHLPGMSENEIDPNQITVQEGRINLVLTDTELLIGGTKTLYSRLVFVLTGETWELVWYEQ